MFMNYSSNQILVTGGDGMVGHALKKIIPNAFFASSKHYDLTYENETLKMFRDAKPKFVIHLAAKVGGVLSNSKNQANYFEDNIRINTNVLRYAKEFKVEKMVSLLSTCIYPENATFPLTEDQIHNGPPHPTNYGYAYAKRMLEVQSRAYREQHGCNFICAVPNNLFGPNDNFHSENSHVIPAIIRKCFEAKKNNQIPEFWGTARPIREFTYSYDVAKILLFLLERYNDAEPINIGNNEQFSIEEIIQATMKFMEFEKMYFALDSSKPDGIFKKPSSNQKLLDLGWKKWDYTPLSFGLYETIMWFEKNYPKVRGLS